MQRDVNPAIVVVIVVVIIAVIAFGWWKLTAPRKPMEIPEDVIAKAKSKMTGKMPEMKGAPSDTPQAPVSGSTPSNP